MKIPKRFKLHGQTIEVVWVEEPFEERSECSGFSSYRKNEIQMRPNAGAFRQTQEQMEQTFLHELVHFIVFHSGDALTGKKDYPHQEEGFIDLTAHLLHQALTTMEYDD